MVNVPRPGTWVDSFTLDSSPAFAKSSALHVPCTSYLIWKRPGAGVVARIK